jgi:hypothetical protein
MIGERLSYMLTYGHMAEILRITIMRLLAVTVPILHLSVFLPDAGL